MGIEEETMIEGIGKGQPPRAVAPNAEAPAKIAAGDPARPAPAAVAAFPVAEQTAAELNLGGIAKALAASPPVDAAKVERLRDGIIRGDYRADPALIAERMIALETLLRKA